MKTIAMQNGKTRYTFCDDGKELVQLKREQLLNVGGTFSYERISKKKAEKLFIELLTKGFKLFRNMREVSWYATSENNTPYEETWETDGLYLIPIKSRILE